jgi:hypothetical protein
MSAITQPASWSIRRFPQKGALPFTLILWCAYFLVVVGTTLVVAPYDGASSWSSRSVWDMATLLPLAGIAFAVGLSLTGFYLRVHVAHGQTRRRFMSQATLYLVVLAAALAALTTLGFVLEAALYRAKDWVWLLTERPLARTVDDYFAMFAMFLLEFAMWMVAGMLVAAGYRRLRTAGLLLTVPLALTMIVLTEDTLGGSDFIATSGHLRDIVTWFSVPSVLLGLVVSWALTRRTAV